MNTSRPITIEDVRDAYDFQLEELNTRHLLSIFRHINGTLESSRRRCRYDDYYAEGCDAKHDMLKHQAARIRRILDTRPHVPNKREARKLRQQAAKAGT